MFTRIAKPIRIIGDPDKRSSIVVQFVQKLEEAWLEKLNQVTEDPSWSKDSLNNLRMDARLNCKKFPFPTSVNLRVPYNVGDFWTSGEPISFLKRTLILQ